MNPLLIYVAGPYSGTTENVRLVNVERAMFAAKVLLDLGHWPLIPHLSHYFDVYVERLFGQRLPSETYYEWDFAILRRCDGLLYLQSSPGADRELALAEELGLPVWRSLDAVPAP